MESTTTLLQPLSITLLLLIPTTFLLLRRHHRQKPPPTTTTTTTTPPSPPSLPLIGHLHLITDMPHHTFTNMSQKLGPIIFLKLGRVPTIVVSNSHFARLILQTHDHVFSSRPQLVSAQYLSFNCSDVTFSPYGPYWRQARKICVTELLSSKRVNSFQFVRNQEVNRMIRSVSDRVGSEIDVSKLVLGLANDVLCQVAFGKRFMEECEEGKKNRLVEIMTETQALFAGFCLGDFYPEWKWVNWVSGSKRRMEKNLEDLRGVCDEIIEEHLERKKKSYVGEEDDKEDFLEVLLRVQKRDDLSVPISDDNLKALVLDMFVAGTDTTAATIEWTMTELARHPKVLQKAQQEVRKIASTDRKVLESHLPNLHYTKSVIKETMRLHPSVPLLVPRESMESCNLDGYEIEAKTRVLINTYAIGRDPEVWDNPLEFRPERFDDDNNVEIKGQDFGFLPFGGGRRGCPGYIFALATVELALARLLYHFDWGLPSGIGVDDVDLSEIFGLATRKKSALVLVASICKDHEFSDYN